MLWRNSRIGRRRWKRQKRALIAARLREELPLYSAWLFIIERAIKRDLRLRPHWVTRLTKLRLDERANTLLVAALRGGAEH